MTSISREDVRFYLVQVDENGDERALQKMYNSNGFNSTTNTGMAYTFETEELAKEGCKLQQMMNEMFGATVKTYYMKETTTRVRYDETGAVAEEPTE